MSQCWYGSFWQAMTNDLVCPLIMRICCRWTRRPYCLHREGLISLIRGYVDNRTTRNGWLTANKDSTTAVLNFILLNITSCSSSRTVEEAVSRKIKSSFFTFLCVEMKAAALLKRQIYRLQFLHRNVKLDVLNGARQLLPAIVFRAWCFSTLLSFSPLKAGEWWTWAGNGAAFGNLRS